MQRICILTALALTLGVSNSFAQYTPPDSSGLESIIVETYYIADGNDAADTDGSDGTLVTGSTTYRVYADLKEGYQLLTVGGFTNHPIEFSTTSTSFFNNIDRGEAWGGDIGASHLDENTVAIDSWLTIGAASDAHWGVLKTEDQDATPSGIESNDGGSVGTPLLANDAAAMGLPLATADGMMVFGTSPTVSSVGTPPECFNVSGNSYSDDNFAWAVLGGVSGPTSENKVLIGQFTTDGTFSFCLNLWVRIPDSLVCNDPNCHTILEYYGHIVESDTAGGGFAADNKFSLPSMCFTSSAPIVDCLGIPGGSALPGTPCDDSNPDTANDTWSGNCVCEGTVGIEEQQLANVRSYPNPAHDLLWLEIGGTHGEHVTIELRDALGASVAKRDLGQLPGAWTGNVNIAGLSSGVYFLEVTIGSRSHMQRISKF